MDTPRLLLHTCCAPCVAYVYRLLQPDYEITSYFYNPNIAPYDEYRIRRDELFRFAEHEKFKVIEGERDHKRWTSRVKEYRSLGERSLRCHECYRIRLEQSFRYAVHNNYQLVATVLSISPHKDADMINHIGSELQEKYGVPFLKADFKKKNGFKKSVEISREHNFYRQNYCGCIYSKLERDKNSVYSR
ncbi:MAG: epoxyqueuosine reductase QueH [Spirochaetota bacterium]